MNIPKIIYPLTCGVWMNKNVYVKSFMDICFHFSWINTQGQSYVKCMFNFVRKCQTFSQVVTVFCISTSNAWECQLKAYNLDSQINGEIQVQILYNEWYHYVYLKFTPANFFN